MNAEIDYMLKKKKKKKTKLDIYSKFVSDCSVETVFPAESGCLLTGHRMM